MHSVQVKGPSRRSGMSLQARLILLVLVPSIPLFAMTFYLTERVSGLIMGHTRGEAMSLAKLASAQMSTIVEIGEHLVMSIAHIPGIAGADRATCERVFNQVLGDARQYASFYVSDEKGNIRCHSASPSSTQNFADRDY